MREFLLLLNVRAAMLVKGITDTRWQTLSKNISSVLIFGGVAVGTFVIVRVFMVYLVHQVHVDLFTVHRLLSFVLFSFFLSVNMVSLLVSYATLYTAEDVPFLFSLPVPHSAVFGVRMVENVVTSGTTLTLLGLAGVLAYGSVFHLDIWSYLFIMFGAFLPFVMIAGMLAVIALALLILGAARIGVRWVMAITIPVYLVVTSLLMRTMDPMTVIRSATFSRGSAAGDAVAGEGAAAGSGVLYWFPSDWMAEFLNALVRHQTAEAWGYAGLLFLLLFILALLAAVVGRRWYYASWLAATEMRMHRTAANGWLRPAIMEFGRFWGYRPHLEAVLKRDFWLFMRDPMQRLHTLIMLFLACAVVVSIRSMDVVIHQPASLVLSFVIVFVFIGFLVSSIILRFVFPTVSLEGDTFWAVRTAPIALSRLYWMKFAVALAAVLLPAELMILLSVPAMPGYSSLLLLAATGMAGLVVALVSLNLGSGAYYATLNEKNPVKVASSQGASVTFLGSLVILLVVAGILALPASVVTGMLGQRSSGLAMTLALGGVVIIASAVTVLSHQLGLRALRKDF
jgi:ABC-2 type transport system permease protein